MSDSRTIRILCIYGGGTKARVPQRFMSKFCTQFNWNPNKIYEYFDVIAGTSSGSMQGAAYALGIAPDTLDPFLLQQSKRIFTEREFPVGCDASLDSNRPNFIEKIGLITFNEPFYKSPCRPNNGNSNFGDNILKSGLETLFGNNELKDLKTIGLFPAFEIDNNRFVYFSNYIASPYEGFNNKIVDVAMSSGAAPIYLPSYTFGGKTYQDGGLFENNPVSAAITLAKRNKPLANRIVVLSLSTGRPKYGFEGVSEGDPTQVAISQILALYQISSSGQQEGANLDLRLRSDSTLENIHYYQFENPFSENTNFELDMSTDEYFNTLDNLTDSTYLAQQTAIQDIHGRLTL